MTHVLIVGYGFCGKAITKALKLVSRETKISITSRVQSSVVPDGVFSVLTFDSTPDFSDITDLIVTAAPDHHGDPFLSRFGDYAFPSLTSVQYLSTTVVYGDADGAWVDESAPLLASSQRGLNRIAAEKAWLRFGEKHLCSVSLLRLAGLYGEGRNALLDLKAGVARRSYKENHVFNRIHGEDVGRISASLVSKPYHGALNMTDDCPAASHLVVEYAASLLKIEPPPLLHVDLQMLSPMALSFWQDHKRVSNQLVKSLTGDFVYPDYKSGLLGLL